MKVAGLQNLFELFGLRQLRAADQAIARATERLATGKRINRAGDDPSGLIAGEELAARSREINSRLTALEHEELTLGAKDGALSVVSDLLLELEGLVVRAASPGGLAEGEAEAMQAQADSILDAMDMIANTATFKGERLFSALLSTSLGHGSAMLGETDENGNEIPSDYTLRDIASGGRLNLVSGNTEHAQKSVRSAVDGIAGQRAAVGARITDGIGSQRRQLLAELEATEQARSTIMDADLATETAALVRAQILQTAAIQAIQFSRLSTTRAWSLLAPAAR